MSRRKLGVLVDGFRVGVRRGVERAAELGFDGLQVYVTGGEMAPEALTRSARREFGKFVAERGLAISALCVELGGYTDPGTVDEKIARTWRMLDLGLDLGVVVHSAHIGRVPEAPGDPVRRTLGEALRALGEYAAERGQCLAAETGPEEARRLREFLESIGSVGLKVNFDPANLVMNGFDPVQGVRELAELIVHTHAKDGIRREDGSKEEVPVGQGQVPWGPYVAALAEAGYEGYYTVEREGGADPAADIAEAKRFLESL